MVGIVACFASELLDGKIGVAVVECNVGSDERLVAIGAMGILFVKGIGAQLSGKISAKPDQAEKNGKKQDLHLLFQKRNGFGEGQLALLAVAEILQLIEDRKNAKKAKNYAEADRIRAYLADKGVTLIDTPQGTTYKIG